MCKWIRICTALILATISSLTTVFCEDGYVTLFRDDFDVGIEHWFGHPISDTGKGYYTYRGGYVFLCIPEGSSDRSWAMIEDSGNDGTQALWGYAGFEARLRCDDDNKMDGDTGGGVMSFGFQGTVYGRLPHMKNQLRFVCYSAGSDPEYAGLRAWSVVDESLRLNEPVEGIDIRDWHTYSILWNEGNATFLVDGVEVASTDSPPADNLAIFVYVQNQRISGPSDQYMVEPMEMKHNISMEVDYIRIFVDDVKFAEMDGEISDLFSQSSKLIGDLELGGNDTSQLWEEYGKAQTNWQVDYYFRDDAKSRLEGIINSIGHWDEVLGMFFKADDAIGFLERDGKTREAAMARGDYSRAEKAWSECDYELTCTYLQKVTARIPELGIYSIIGIYLLWIFVKKQ